MSTIVTEQLPYLCPEKLFPYLHQEPGFCWLDGSGERFGGCSVFCRQPFLILQTKARQISLLRDGYQCTFSGSPFQVLRQLLRENQLPEKSFWGPGCFGYLSYDLGRQIESIPEIATDDLKIPDLWLGFYDKILVFSHRKKQLWLQGANLARKKNFQSEWRQTVIFWKEKIKKSSSREKISLPRIDSLSFNMTREFYVQAVKKIKDYIAAGDVYQINFAQRLQAKGFFPETLYLQMRRVNPTLYGGFLQTGKFSLLSNSPELFLRKKGRLVITRPMKGTRPRGSNPDQDSQYKEQLLKSEKEAAELLMIVDLERNDLGRVCQTGSVTVERLRILERYPTVFQTTSLVKGILKPELDVTDLILATFPGGSITGAPKIRAMEIIEELEPHRRGFYTGCFGYLGFNGCLQLNILIRTIMLQSPNLYYPVGGGIVWDSLPEQEYEETLIKAQALFLTLGVSREGKPVSLSV